MTLAEKIGEVFCSGLVSKPEAKKFLFRRNIMLILKRTCFVLPIL